MKISISKWLVSALVASAPLIAGAQTLGTLKGDITAVDTMEKYRLNPTTKVYEVTSVSTRSLGSIQGTGALSSMNSAINDKKSVVPGVDFKGYQRLSVTPKNGKLFLVADGAINDVIEGLRIDYSSKIEIEVEFVAGTMQDLTQGQRVIVKPTEDGKKVLVAEAAKSFSEMMKQALRSGGLAGFVIDSSLDQTEVSDNIRYEISKDEISVSNPSMRWLVTFTVKK